MKIAVLLPVLLSGALCPQRLAAQAAPATGLSSNRWLFVVETSRSMQPRSEAVNNIVGNLIWSGMSGQMRQGDTMGLWTFNESLYHGQFPLQRWSPGAGRSMASRTVGFLTNQKFEKEASLDKVLPAIVSLAKQSDFITVILVTDGSGKIEGTPFDDKINTIHQAWREEQKKTKQPILTILQARHGRFTNYVVNTPPWPLQMPPLPAQLQAAAPAERSPGGATSSTVASLIVHGTKRVMESTLPAVEAPPAEIAPASDKAPVPAWTTSEPARVETQWTSPMVSPPPAQEVSVNATGLPVQAAVAAPPEASSRGKLLWIAGLVVVVVAAGVVFLLMRRPRSKVRISLGKPSADREQK